MDEPIFMITTKDNPYSPFTQSDEWDVWDRTHGWHIDQQGRVRLGYCTSAYLARVCDNAEEGISPAQYNRACNNAYDEIVELNLTGNYVKVQPSDYDHWVPTKETVAEVVV